MAWTAKVLAQIREENERTQQLDKLKQEKVDQIEKNRREAISFVADRPRHPLAHIERAEFSECEGNIYCILKSGGIDILSIHDEKFSEKLESWKTHATS